MIITAKQSTTINGSSNDDRDDNGNSIDDNGGDNDEHQHQRQHHQQLRQQQQQRQQQEGRGVSPEANRGGGELAFSRPWPISHGVACPTSSVPSTAKAEFMPNLEQPSMHAYINVHSTNTSYMYKSPRAVFQGIEVVWKHHPHVIVVILKSTVIVSSITIIIIIIIVNLVILIIAITIISMLLSRS